VQDPAYDAGKYYDRVSQAWTSLLGEDLHYGVFREGDEDLPSATAELTRIMAEAAEVTPGVKVLDVGCGTGMPACYLAARHGARVTGISTSAFGVRTAREKASAAGLGELLSFEERDGMDTGFPSASFDRVWVLESSHLMRDRERLMQECARVLRSGGRLALCDIMLRKPLPFERVRELREPLTLLRNAFGDAHMEPPSRYVALARSNGMEVERELDLTALTRPTFGHWRRNAELERESVSASLGGGYVPRFIEACGVLERFWDDGTLGYGLLAAVKP
jgi:27-O-demethylrifamycin SV methyltransferase